MTEEEVVAARKAYSLKQKEWTKLSTPEERKEMMAKCKTPVQLAKQYGYSKAQMSRILRDYGITSWMYAGRNHPNGKNVLLYNPDDVQVAVDLRNEERVKEVLSMILKSPDIIKSQLKANPMVAEAFKKIIQEL